MPALRSRKKRKTPEPQVVKTDSTTATQNTSGLSEYELARLENIRRNNEFLKELGIEDTVTTLRVHSNENSAAKLRATRARAAQRAKKRKQTRQLPRRVSRRQRGQNPDGTALPADFKALPHNSRGRTVYEEPAPVSLEISPDGMDFLRTLKTEIEEDNKTSGKVSNGQSKTDSLEYAKRLAQLSVDDDHGFRKLTPERIYSLAFSPATKHIVIAAGDKQGNLGIWRVGASSDDPDDPSDRNGKSGGVLTQRAHRSVIAGLLFQGATKLLTSSYDGTMRCLDLNHQQFSEAYSGEVSLYGLDAPTLGSGGAASSSMYVAQEDGCVMHWDMRAAPNKASASGPGVSIWQLHSKKINTVSVFPGQDKSHYLATASLDRLLCIWDVRYLRKSGSENQAEPLLALSHGLSINSAFWSPTGAHVVSVCQDNILRVFDGLQLRNSAHSDPPKQTSTAASAPPESVSAAYAPHHNCRTGRWLTKFQARWDSQNPDCFVIGSMNQPRCVEVYNARSKCKQMRLRHAYVGSVQSLTIFHPKQTVLGTANSSGRVYIWN